jgi:hypothetical protein
MLHNIKLAGRFIWVNESIGQVEYVQFSEKTNSETSKGDDLVFSDNVN